jgi:hypothetical protein
MRTEKGKRNPGRRSKMPVDLRETSCSDRPSGYIRTIQVYRCDVCHSHTNRFENNGRRGVSPVCPVSARKSYAKEAVGRVFEDMDEYKKAKSNHEDIKELEDRKYELNNRIELYGENAPTELWNEIDVVERRIGELTEWFEGRYRDVVGIGDDYEVYDSMYDILHRKA